MAMKNYEHTREEVIRVFPTRKIDQEREFSIEGKTKTLSGERGPWGKGEAEFHCLRSRRDLGGHVPRVP